MTEENSKLVTFETTRGYTLKVRGISGWLQGDVLGGREEPAVPTYSVQTKAGTQTFQHYHDPEKPEKSTLKNDEQRREWEQYQEDVSEYNLWRNRELMKLYINEAIVNPPMPTPQWVDRMRSRYKLEIPEDDDDLAVFFYEREVFGSFTDMTEFMLSVMKAGGDVSDERINAVAESFRRSVSRLADVAFESAEGGVDIQHQPGEGVSGEGVESDAVRVPEQESDGPSNYDGDGESGGGQSSV